MTSSVAHLGRADDGCDIHVWLAPNPQRLTRTNKLSSKLFRSPETDGASEFRLLLLRGVVKSETPEADAVAIYLEYMPNPTADTTGCQVKATISFATEQGAALQTHQLTDTFAFTPDARMFGFKQALSATEFHKAIDVLVVRLQLNHNPPTHVQDVLTTTLGFGRSLWREAQTSFASLKAVVGGALSREEAHQRTDEPALCPWDNPPPLWRSNGRPARWRYYLCEYMPQSEGAFLTGPRPFTSEEELLLSQAGLSANACLNAARTFHYEDDVHPALLAEDQIHLRTMRFELVPLRVGETDFWKAYFWRIRCLERCETEEQAHMLLSILDAPPPGASRDPSAHTTPPISSPTRASAAHGNGMPQTPKNGDPDQHPDESSSPTEPRMEHRDRTEEFEYACQLVSDSLQDKDPDATMLEAAVDVLESLCASPSVTEAQRDTGATLVAAARQHLAAGGRDDGATVQTSLSATRVQSSSTVPSVPPGDAAQSREVTPDQHVPEAAVDGVSQGQEGSEDFSGGQPAVAEDKASAAALSAPTPVLQQGEGEGKEEHLESPAPAQPLDNNHSDDTPAAGTSAPRRSESAAVLMPWEEEDDG